MMYLNICEQMVKVTSQHQLSIGCSMDVRLLCSLNVRIQAYVRIPTQKSDFCWSQQFCPTKGSEDVLENNKSSALQHWPNSHAIAGTILQAELGESRWNWALPNKRILVPLLALFVESLNTNSLLKCPVTSPGSFCKNRINIVHFQPFSCWIILTQWSH